LKLSQLFWETGKPCFPKKSGHIFLSIFTEFIGYIANNIGMRKSVLVGVEKRKLMVTFLKGNKKAMNRYYYHCEGGKEIYGDHQVDPSSSGSYDPVGSKAFFIKWRLASLSL